MQGRPAPAPPPPRLRFLPALSKPLVAILCRRRAKLYHVMLWNTADDSVAHGSWFHGRIYEDLSDISPDGKWMTYFALGGSPDGPKSWSAICRPPWLRAVLYHQGTGGVWGERCIFRPDGTMDAINWREPLQSDVEPADRRGLPNIIFNPPGTWPPQHATLLRDGWKVVPQSKASQRRTHLLLHPTPEHPAIRLYNPTNTTGRGLIEVDTLGLTLHPQREWACYDARNQLVIARRGRVERWSLRDIKSGEPGFVLDLNDLQPPARAAGQDPDPGGR